jgi:anti-sigma factor RsiW
MTLPCEQARALLAPWVDDELSAADRTAMNSHLARCQACAQRGAHERAARDLLAARRETFRSQSAPAGLRARLAASAPSAVSVATGRAWRRGYMSLAATLLLAFSGLTLHVATGRSTTLLAAQLAADHVKCHLTERDRGSLSPEPVQHRLAERYGFHAKVPASSADHRVRLIGARRCLTGEGTNAHILYRVDGRPVSLYLVPEEGRPATNLSVLGRDAVVWSRDNGTYVLVADQGVDNLGELARYMQRATE